MYCSFCRSISPLLAAIPDDVNTILEPPFRVDDNEKCLRLSISSATKHERNCDAPQPARRMSCGTRRCCEKVFGTCVILFCVKSCSRISMFQIFAGKSV